MLSTLAKIPFYKAMRRFGWPHILPLNYTIILSMRCNSRCKTCNVWKMDPYQEMSREEWQKIFRSMGRSPYWLTFSGGEPFMRLGFTDIIQDAYRICKPKIINIPTNSLLGAKVIAPKVKEIAQACPNSSVVINLSLDGIGEKHDEIRGIEGNFEKVMEVYKALRELNFPNLSIGIHSVVSKFNFDHIKDLHDYVKELGPDQYISEIAEERVELDTVGMPITPDFDEYSLAINYLIEKLEKSDPKKIGRLTKYFRIQYYKMVKRWLQKREQMLPCYAGVASTQISVVGDVWPCCIRADSMGNLKDNDFDFRKVWFSKKGAAIRKSIYEKECNCPLANAAYSTMLCNIKTMSKVGYKYLRKE